jgi:hypothetical protein
MIFIFQELGLDEIREAARAPPVPRPRQVTGSEGARHAAPRGSEGGPGVALAREAAGSDVLHIARWRQRA